MFFNHVQQKKWENGKENEKLGFNFQQSQIGGSVGASHLGFLMSQGERIVFGLYH